MATGSFSRTLSDIDLDDGNQDSVPIDSDNEEVEEVRIKVSSFGTSKRKRKMLKKVSLMNKLNMWVNNLVRLLTHWNNLL
ncbi:hypothetical protein Gotri_015126 [Gossypium trilobum]|uniref:Uncharacterized protein n=1 Tax=Gossypium trilobum TaxID=34281 RepID=A0A7J9DZ78_9ROSI|nr:hypothetical protein [Gossypium trilobum]